MAENEDEVPAIKEENESTSEIQQLQHLEDSEEMANDQKKFNKEMLENQRKIIEQMETIQEKLDGRKRKSDDEGLKNPAKRIPPTMTYKFVLRHVFENVSKLEEDEHYESVIQEHFGVPWGVSIHHEDNHLGIYLNCERSEDEGKWSIDTDFHLKIIHPNGKSVVEKVKYIFDEKTGYGNGEFIKWEDMLNSYSMDDKLIVKAHVTINKMTGIYKDNLRSFDESMIDVSDIVLIVQDEKFYVSKLTLSAQSSFFKTMFLGKFDESRKSEIKLSEINSEDFQKYLEVLYGEQAIDEATVDGILLVADKFDTPIVTRKCEEFMLEKSKKALKKKLQMSVRYNLENLKKKCLSGIRTRDDIRSMMPIDVNDLDPSIANVLLEKALLLR